MASLWAWAFHSHTGTGIEIVTTGHVKFRWDSGGTSDASADQVRDALHTALTTKYRACLTSDDTVDDLTIREIVTPGSGAVPAQSIQSVALAGSIGHISDRVPDAASLLVKILTNAAVRSGHGRMWFPLTGDANDLASAGGLDPTSTLWVNVGLFMTEVNSNHNIASGTVFGHLAEVVYSRTRHARGDSDYYFDMTGFVRRPAVHWLRSRTTAP